MLLVSSSACRSGDPQPTASSENRNSAEHVVVAAPEAGVVRAVLVRDGDAVEQGATIVEITVKGAASAQNQPAPKTAANGSARVALAAAEAEATRAAEKVRRIEPLVSKGYASRADLDTARTNLQDAQARLQRARELVQAQDEKARQEQAAKADRVVLVQAPVKGVIQSIGAKPGEAVTTGQPLLAVNKSS
jgi:multidrug resistance efflux pump